MDMSLKRWMMVHSHWFRSLAVRRSSKGTKTDANKSISSHHVILPSPQWNVRTRSPMGVSVLGLSFIVHVKNDRLLVGIVWRGSGGRDEGGIIKLNAHQPWSSSKHVSHTRTGFLEDGVRAFRDEHSAQKMFPQCRQWCCNYCF